MPGVKRGEAHRRRIRAVRPDSSGGCLARLDQFVVDVFGGTLPAKAYISVATAFSAPAMP